MSADKLPPEGGAWGLDFSLGDHVHSSVQGPSGWALLADALEDRGHRAIMPDLGDVDPEAIR